MVITGIPSHVFFQFPYILLMQSELVLYYSYTHAAACSFDHAHSCFYGCSVQVWHLKFCDFLYLSFCNLSNFCLVRNTWTRFKVAGFLNKNCCRRSLCNEAETSVTVNCNYYRNDQISLISCLCVELFCKFNDVYTVLSKSRTNRWSRSSLSSWNL